MIAMEAEEQSGIINAVKDIVKACTFDALNVTKMPMFDVEYVFLQIRAKSVGEVSKLKLRCLDDKETYVETEIDLTEVKVEVDKEHTNKIELTDDMGMIMTYPTIDLFQEIGINEISADSMIDLISSCISQIYEDGGETVFEAKDSTKKELNEFIEQLDSKQFLEVQAFFDTMPKLKHEITVKNPKTEVESKVILTGLNDFFA